MNRTACAALIALAGCGGEDPPRTCWPAEPPRLAFTEVPLDGDEVGTTGLVFRPGGDELLLLSKSGRITHYRLVDGGLELLGAFSLPEVRNTGDCGLISAAFEPAGRYLFVAHCLPDDSGRPNRLVRLDFQPPDYDATVASAETILEVTDPEIRAGAMSHTLGRLVFADDGTLYAPMGDRGVEERAPDPASNLGKILRYDPGSTSPEIHARGLRNPWTATLDHLGRLWVGDVGSDRVEEINLVAAAGADLGWPASEGPCDGCGTVDPVFHWGRSSGHDYVQADPEATPTPSRVAWVGAEYRPGPDDRYDGLLDHALLFGDSCVGFLRAARLADDGTVCDAPVGHLSNVVDVRQGPDGYLYAVTFGTCNTGDPIPPGRLFRVELAAP